MSNHIWWQAEGKKCWSCCFQRSQLNDGGKFQRSYKRRKMNKCILIWVFFQHLRELCREESQERDRHENTDERWLTKVYRLFKKFKQTKVGLYLNTQQCEFWKDGTTISPFLIFTNILEMPREWLRIHLGMEKSQRKKYWRKKRLRTEVMIVPRCALGWSRHSNNLSNTKELK